MKKIRSIVLFWLLVMVFVFMIATIVIPSLNEVLVNKFLILGGGFMLLFLGIALMISATKEQLDISIKKSLILTGASATGFFVSIILHNLLYALGILVQDYQPLLYLSKILSGLFFLFAIFVCPIGFLTGVVKTCILWKIFSNNKR